MIVSPGPDHTTSIMGIEFGLTLIAVAAAFVLPGIGSAWFTRIEAAFGRLARRRWAAVAVVGLTEFVLRLSILPCFPVPRPFVQDDFSFLLAADTFASGRLTNPTPAMWRHFESFHIVMNPTYMSMYFPGQGLILAAGRVLFGNPWIGVLVVTALMCAAICWMLQAWLPPSWALLGGMIAVLHLGLFSYWINTYTGAASVAALGGALVLGAFPRLIKNARVCEGILLAGGIVLLALSRPYEGFLLCLPVAGVLGRWILFGKNRPVSSELLRRAALPLALIIAAGSWMAYYDDRVNGSALTLPYTINRATYAIAPYWIWQSPRPAPVYRHTVMRDYYEQVEMSVVKKAQSLHGFLFMTSVKAILAVEFFAGAALLPPLIMLPRVFRDRRTRFIVICCFVWALGMALQIFMVCHYLAPFTAAFYVVGLQATRHLRVWRPSGQPVGVQMVRLIAIICIAMTALRVWAEPLHLNLAAGYPTAWTYSWYGPGELGGPRARVESDLRHLPGKQLAIVRYSPGHDSEWEWVYNDANIQDSKIIWARDMGSADNLEIIHYYRERKVWLVQPDLQPATISPYPIPEQAAGAQHGAPWGP